MRDATTIAPGIRPTQAPPAATRRSLFGTAAAMLLLTAAEAGTAKAAELDGDLIALSAEYVAMQRAAVVQTPGEKDAAAQACPLPWTDEARHAPDKLLVARIARLPARTPEGLHAKAQALWWHYGGTDEWEPFAWRTEDALIASVLDDVLGRAGA